MRLSPAFVVGSLLAAAGFAAGCIKEMSSEERLDRATANLRNDPPTLSAEELGHIRCTDVDGDLAKARNVDRPETERVQTYCDLYTGLKEKTHTLQNALQRNPDLSYREEAEKIRSARDACVQQTADVRVELERFVRELVEVPIVQEVRGGRAVSVARLDFTALRKAIAVLDTDDRENMLQRVTNAEKRVEAKSSDIGGSSSGRHR